MKQLLISIIVVAAVAMPAHAADYDYLVFQNADGSVSSFAVGSLKITFANGQLQLVNSETSQSFSLQDLAKMYFSNSVATSVEPLLPASEQAEVEVFAASGVAMGRFDSLSQAQERLAPGVYVVKQSGKTFKIAVK